MKLHSRKAFQLGLLFAVSWVLLGSAALGQVSSRQAGELPYAARKESVPDAIAKVNQGDFGAVHVSIIERADATSAIPALEKQFALSQYPNIKGKIAGALVRLGNRNNAYGDYLVRQATAAIDNDAPSVIGQDLHGKSGFQPSPAFLDWAKVHHLSPGEAAEDVLYIFPGEVGFLADASDPRAIPLLRKGLRSQNFMVQVYASRGLAQLGDAASVPLIVDACKGATPEIAELIAESLVYFDDPVAQRAADKYIPKDQLASFREARRLGKKAMD